MERVVAFVDGLNLYHALDSLSHKKRQNYNHVKWLDLWKLSEVFIKQKTQILVEVNNYTAYATHLPDPYKRHREYIKALNTIGVRNIFGNFKDKTVWVKCCNDGNQKVFRNSHEEKETDVNIALEILDKAYKDEYDHAFILSRDSDICPALKLVKSNFPNKKFTIIAPPFFGHSTALLNQADEKRKLKIQQLERCLLPVKIIDEGLNIIAECPEKYLKSAPDKDTLLKVA